MAIEWVKVEGTKGLIAGDRARIVAKPIGPRLFQLVEIGAVEARLQADPRIIFQSMWYDPDDPTQVVWEVTIRDPIPRDQKPQQAGMGPQAIILTAAALTAMVTAILVLSATCTVYVAREVGQATVETAQGLSGTAIGKIGAVVALFFGVTLLLAVVKGLRK